MGVTVPIKTAAIYPPPPAPQSATPAEVNRIEQAATPHAFAFISLSNNPGAANLNLNGQILLGEQSDSLNPARDRLVIALGSSLTVLEPGALRPSGQSNRVWTYQNPSHPRVRKVILQRHSDQSWQFEISSRASMPENQRFYLRIGNDWGGINLSTGEMLLQMQPSLNYAFQSQAMIGNAGGTVQTTDASGVVISLSIPPGALSEATLITVTPLESSPLVAPSGALHPGVKFEPEGLQFARPATLTLDFSATARQITNKDFIYLMTSPMTMVPLYGRANPATKTLTALVHHFSALQPGAGDPALSDLAAWVNDILSSGQNLTLAEIQSVIAAANTLLQQGCQQNCIDTGLMAQRVGESIKAIVTAECPDATTNPTDAAFNRLGQLEALSQQVGVSVPEIRTCMEQVLRGLIEKAALAGVANPSDTTLQRVIDLWGRAEQSSFPDLVTLARQKTEDVFRALIDRDGATAAADPSDANLRRLLDLKARAQQLGFSDRERQALVKVAAGVRVMISRASAQCATNEAAARREFLRAQTWHAAVSLDPTVDPTLSRAIQDAIDNCGGSEMRTLVWGNYATEAAVLHYATTHSEQRTLECYNNFGDKLPQNAPPPVFLRNQRCNSYVENRLTEPSRNVLAWDVSYSTAPDTYITDFTMVTLTFNRAGTLKLEANPDWLTDIGDNGANYHLLLVRVWRPSSVLSSPNVSGLVMFYPFPNNPIPGEHPLHGSVTGPTTTHNISGPGTVDFMMYTGGANPVSRRPAFGSSASGRLLTVTFTPQSQP
ncbi:MAG: hypothetical protein LC802_01655 [Acidobacteria bacterium]|nr:hypothetical protein [Acidobacteriota bacterium]